MSLSYIKDNKVTPLYRFLDTVGDGTGTKIAIGNYSDAGLGLTEFKIAPPVDPLGETKHVYVLERMVVQCEDTGSLDAGNYGNGIVLTNGMDVHVEETDNTLILDLSDGLNVHSAANWGRLCYDVTETSFGTGNNFMEVRWTFSKSGHPLYIYSGQKFVIHLNDDFSGLVSHTFKVQGYALQVEPDTYF